MMQNNLIFKNYKQRLINIDSRNSSFFLSILRSKSHIDIQKVINDLKINLCLKTLIHQNHIRLIRKKINKADFINTLRITTTQDSEQLRMITPLVTNQDILKNEELIKSNPTDKKYNDFANELYKRIETEYEKIFRQFNQLLNNSKVIERETGKNDLYLGYPFIEGMLENEKDVRGPLILHRISIINNDNLIDIKIHKEGKIINPVILFSYLNESQKDTRKIDFEIPDNISDYLTYAYDFMKSHGMDLRNINERISTIESLTKSEYTAKYQNIKNIFNVSQYAVLGLFPLSNRNIYNDLDYLDKFQETSSQLINQLLSGTREFDDESLDYPQKEEYIKYVSPLDYSQRTVINSALTKNLVIEGPPGTGKSQTIVNLIINLLLRNKKILVVSEKLAAIEVVYNRLGSLRENTLIVNDYFQQDKNDFFYQVLNAKSSLNNHIIKPLFDNTIDESINEYISNTKEINNLHFCTPFNYKEVLDLSMDGFSMDTITHELPIIKSYVNHIREQQANIKNEVKKLLSKQIIDSYEYFSTIKDNKLFSLIPLKDVYFLLSLHNSKQNKKQIQYNYYLRKTNVESLNSIITTKFSINKDTRLFNYTKFDEYADLLYKQINEYKQDIIEFINPLYGMLNKSKQKIDLSINWLNLTLHEQDIRIKSIFDQKFKYSFISKLFKKKVVLNNEESEFKDYLNNYCSSFNIDALRNINNNFIEIDIHYAEEYIKRGFTSKDELISLLLSSDLVEFKDSTFDNIYTQLIESKSLLDYNHLRNVSNLSDLEFKILDIMLVKKITVSDLTKYIYIIYIGDDSLNKARQIADYFKDGLNVYNNTIDCLNEKYDLSSDFVYAHVKNNITRLLHTNPILNNMCHSLIAQAEMKRRKSIRFVFEKYSDAITTLFPIILMKPDVVSTVFKMSKDMFDYVIFDEASQIFIERAIPSIHRGKNIIVAGDSKQLRPSSTFTSRLNDLGDYEDDELTFEELEALDKESLLDIAKSKLNSKMLKFHYRSSFKELIEFSSFAFYDKKLFFESDIKNYYGQKPIEIIKTDDGIWEKNNTNVVEAKKVVELVQTILEKRSNNETLGIITFNIHQKELIQSLLDNSSNELIRYELQRINHKTKDDESLFVKNLENVQGDERDIIIFSIGYAKTKDGKIRSQFGLLNQSGGENRLNVAITRAKKKIFIVKSINASDLRINDKNEGPLKLKQYLEYAEHVDSGNTSSKNILLGQLNQTDHNIIKHHLDIENSIEFDVYNELLKVISADLYLVRQVNIGEFYIDIAVYQKESNKFILGIECDGFIWNSNPHEKENDFYKEQYLKSRGWNIMKIYSTNWINDKDKELSLILREIEKNNLH